MRFLVCAALLAGCADKAGPATEAEPTGRLPELHYFEISPQ